MFEEVTEDLEEDDEAGDPEAGEEGVVDDVEHSDLEPGERSSAEEICKFQFARVFRFSFVFQVAPCKDGAVVGVEEHVLEGLPSGPVPADLGHGVKNMKDGIKYKRCILQLWKISP